MNNLKKYAGLLNDIAPKGEFLAYINQDEAEMLKDNGALGLMTPQGIPSYRGAGGYQGGGGSSSGGSRGGSGGGGSSSGGGGGRDSGGGGGGRDYSPPSRPSTPSAPPSKPSKPSAPPGGGGRDLGAQEAARQEAARQEAARQEAARQEAARQEAARQEEAMKAANKKNVLKYLENFDNPNYPYEISGLPSAPPSILNPPTIDNSINTAVAPPSILSPPPDTREQYSTETQYQTTPQALGLVDAEDEYLAPDPEHFNKTQKEINKRINEAKQEGNYDVELTKEQYEQFNKDLNEYYGTEGVKYEPYGRAGKGTVNLSFGEHWQNLGMQYPVLKLSPTARFLGALGRNVNEYLTSDYGTGQYGGAGTMGSSYAVDRGGLLGRLGMTSGTGGQDGMIDTGGDATTTTQPTAPTTTLPPSMVNQYFANMGDMGNALSSQLQTDYNNAKNSINSILGITPPSQQFGYSADPYGGLMASNLTTNPYNIDYLRRLGLI